jgi:hypothetical protein
MKLVLSPPSPKGTPYKTAGQQKMQISVRRIFQQAQPYMNSILGEVKIRAFLYLFKVIIKTDGAVEM